MPLLGTLERRVDIGGAIGGAVDTAAKAGGGAVATAAEAGGGAAATAASAGGGAIATGASAVGNAPGDLTGVRTPQRILGRELYLIPPTESNGRSLQTGCKCVEGPTPRVDVR